MTARNRAIVLISAIALSSLGLGFGLRHWWVRASKDGAAGTAERIVLEPQKFVVSGPVLEYDSPTAEFTVRNGTDETLIVKKISPSCPCIHVTLADGTAVATPLNVPPQGSVKLSARISTVGLWGKQVHKIQVECQASGVEFLLVSELELEVRPSARAYPSTVALHDNEPGTIAHQTIDIYDAYPDPGLEFGAVKVSDPKVVRFELKTVPPGESAARLNDPKNLHPNRPPFRHRYTVELSYTIPSESRWFEDSLLLVPKKEGVPPLVIPIVGRPRRSGYAAFPSRITVYLPKGERSARRLLACKIPEGAAANLVVVSVPTFVDAKIVQKDVEAPQIEVVCSLPPAADGPLEGEIKIGVEPQRQIVLTIPVKVYPAAKAATTMRSVLSAPVFLSRVKEAAK